MFQIHTALSLGIKLLEGTFGITFPNATLDAYYHYEALVNHKYSFCCRHCGDNPEIIILDANKKGAFGMNGMHVQNVKSNKIMDIIIYLLFLAQHMSYWLKQMYYSGVSGIYLSVWHISICQCVNQSKLII